MHAIALLHKILVDASLKLHKARVTCLLKVTEGLFNQGKLSLTSLGRHLKGASKVKHKIKKVDRLLGNKQLYSERMSYYKAMSRAAIGARKQVTVLIDWSPSAEHNNQILRASLALKHRSITLYEEVQSENKLGHYDVHQLFLKRLKQIIPEGIEVLIVTDAGFRTEWFQLVLEQGWHFEGRIRTKIAYSEDNGQSWKDYKLLYKDASNQPSYRGEVLLAKSTQLPCYMYLYKESIPKKKNYKRKRNQGKMIDIYRKAYKDPWMLVTSVPPTKNRNAEWVVKQYKKRMKIEHEFRDTKDAKWGIGLRYAKTRDRMRLELLLLIGTLALFALWLIGLYAEKNNKHYSYQANTVKSFRVLSLVFLGLQIILHEPDWVTEKNLTEILTYQQSSEMFND